MGIQIAKEIDGGIDVNYFRVTSFTVPRDAASMNIKVEVWKNKAAFDGGKQSLNKINRLRSVKLDLVLTGAAYTKAMQLIAAATSKEGLFTSFETALITHHPYFQGGVIV